MESPQQLLLDADGVLQRHPDAVTDLVRRVVGSGPDEWLVARYADRAPGLAGDGDLRLPWRERVRVLGPRALPLEVHRRVWLRVHTHTEVLDLVAQLRRGGLPVHLATNQRAHRGAHMREVLGYDAHFDSCWYSHELGVAKPAPAYFEAVAAGIGARPRDCLLVDDNAANVRSAARLGMRTVRWTTREGVPALRARLAAHGIPVDSRA
ncbi:HAD-IA family hydrolase [Nocardioides nanhaiensis]|uniref:HAD family hydrolase n=1 Tax=Nocardioides nanhaiensis TaxID=1476871 RepID=A0ABP8VZA6_9ACTN